jgi:hypothetical protein
MLNGGFLGGIAMADNEIVALRAKLAPAAL